jgi:hypothetical protein
MLLKLKQEVELFTALKSLDGVDRVVRAEGQPDRIVRESYTFGGKFRWNVAKNLGLLKRSIEAYEEARTALIKSLSPDGVGISVEDKVAFAAFNLEHEKMLNEPDDLPGLLTFSEDDLATDKNPIPPSTLMALMPLITAPSTPAV